jgi:hypothetical protein
MSLESDAAVHQPSPVPVSVPAQSDGAELTVV